MALVGERIRQRRIALDWGQDDLGRRTGMAAPAVSAVEHGRRNLTLQSLLKFAHALDVDPADLVRGPCPPSLNDAAMHAIAQEQRRLEVQTAAAEKEVAARRIALHADHERRVTSIMNKYP
jgi:transcriptional regulator with XRE-family HTH domain